MGKKIVLLYHRVNNTENDYNRITVEEANFRAHMVYLKENYKVLSFEELLIYDGTEDVVAVTFDDGFADFYGKALPILMQLKIPATIFIATAKLNTQEELWTTEILRLLFTSCSGEEEIHIELCGKQIDLPIFIMEQRSETYRILRHVLMQLSAGERDAILDSIRRQLNMNEQGREEYRFMSFSEIQKIAANPLVTIGAHTVNHISMGRISDEELLSEIQESIRTLENLTGQRLKYFAYPFGGKFDYSDKAIELLCKDGIEAACTVEGRIYDQNRDSCYKIPRLCIRNWTLEQFRNNLEEWIVGHKQKEPLQDRKSRIYIGKLEADKELCESDKKVIIWGTGIRGKKIYSFFAQRGQVNRVIAFGDNDPGMWEQRINNIPVWNIEKIREQKNIDIVIYNTHDMQLVQQLLQNRFDYLHWII